MKPKMLRFRGPGHLALAAFLFSLSIPMGATAPTTPYERLEIRAAQEGAAAVRAEYRRETDAIVAALALTPEPRTLAESLERNLRRAWFHQFLRSWARVEARDVRAGKANGSLAEALVMPLLDNFDCLEQSDTSFALDRDEIDRLRAEATPEERARLGLAVSPVASFERDRLQALRQMALLAKLGRNRAALERIFEHSGGRVDSCTTPDEFLAFAHDWEAALGTVTAASGAGGGR